MSDFYTSAYGDVITRSQLEKLADEAGLSSTDFETIYGYTLADRNEEDTDNNVIDNKTLEYEEPETNEIQAEPVDPMDQMFDSFELEQEEKDDPLSTRVPGYRKFFDNTEEEEGITLLKSYFPDFTFEEATYWGGSTQYLSTDAIKVTSPDGEHSIKLELDMGDFDIDPYYGERRGKPYSHIDENYLKLKDFIKQHTVDIEGTLNAQANMGDIQIDVKDDEGEIKTTMSVENIFTTSHIEGGAGIDESDIQAINEKYRYDPDTDTYDLSIFDVEVTEKEKFAFNSKMSGSGSFYTETTEFKPYEAELEQTRKRFEAQAEKNPEFKYTDEDIKKYTAMTLRSNEISEKKAYYLEQFIDSQPEATQGVMQAYNLQQTDKAQKESIKKSILAEQKLSEATERQEFLQGYMDWYENPNQTWNFPDDFQGEVVQLPNGKITPKDQYLNFIQLSREHDSFIEHAKRIQKQAFEAQQKVEDREAQWNLLRRDYDIWSKSGANIALGASDIIAGGAYMLHKLNKYSLYTGIGVLNPFTYASWYLDDNIDDAAANYYQWSQEAREDYQRDIKFDDAFSDGNFGEFFMSEVSKQIPIIASIIASGGTYAPYVIGGYSAGQEFMRLEHSNQFYGTDYGEGEMFMRSVGYGTAEGVLGTLPTVLILGRGAQMMSNRFGKEWIKNAGLQYTKKNAMPSLVYSPLIEGISEGATAFSQNMINYAAGDLHWTQVTEGMDHAAFVGGMMGLVMGGTPFTAGAIVNSMGNNSNLEQILALKQRYQSLSDKTTDEAKQLVRDMDALYRKELARFDRVDKEGLQGYESATRNQAEIMVKVEEIMNSDKSNEQKNKEIGVLKILYDGYQGQRDVYRSEQSFGDAFAVLETNNKDLYDTIRKEAMESFDGQEMSEDKIKDKMRQLYYEDQIDKQIETDKKVNSKLGRKLEVVSVEKAVDVVRDVINQIKNNESNLLPNGKLNGESQTQVDRLEKEINKIREGKKNGFYVEGPKTKYLIRDNMINNQKVYTGVHELGHDIFEDMAINDPTFFDDMAEQILAYTKATNTGLYNRLNVRSKNKGNEELVMEFLEDIAENRINIKKEGYLSGIIGFIMNNKSDNAIPFKSKQDTVEWLVTLGEKLRDGDINKTQLKKDIADARRERKGNRVKKKITDKDASIKSSDAADVTRIYDERGTDGSFDILEKYRGMANKLANKYREVPGYDTMKDDLVEEILTGKRGVYDLIQAYNPKSGVPLPAYINKYIKSRSIEAANRVLKTNFELDVTEARGVAATETEVSIENQTQTNSRLRRQLNIPESIVDQIKNAVEKTFGTRLPDVNSKDFKKALQDSYRTELFKTIKNLIGTRTKFRNYLDKNFEAIYKALPQSIINKRFKPFAENTGKREKTPQGNTIFKKKNITKEEFINYFLGDNVGNSTKGTRKDALAEALAEELAFDATMEVVQRPEVMQRRAMIAELDGTTLMDNDIAVIAKQIDRDPTVKFSEISVPKGVDPSTYVNEQFIPQAKDLYQLVQDLSYNTVYEENKGLYITNYNKDVWNFVDKMYKEGKIDDNGNVNWKNWAKGSSIAEVNNIYDIISERGALTNKSDKTIKDEYLRNIKILAKDLGSDIMELFGKDMELLGFVYRALDPAKTKKQTGKPGDYFKSKEDLKAALESKLNLNFDINDVQLMNIKFPLFKKIQKILNQDVKRNVKIKQLQELKTEIDNANTANIGLATHIVETMAKSEMTDVSIYDMLQIQSNIVGGLKGTSRLDFIQVLDGSQGNVDTKTKPGEYKKHPKYKEVKKYIEDINKKLKPENQKTPAEIESAIKSALNPKGEHVGAWLKTAQDLADAIFNYRYNKVDKNGNHLSQKQLEARLNKEINEALKNHTQYLTEVYDTKAIDRVQVINGKIVIAGSTSGRNIARLENTQAIGILGETMVERQAKLVAENELNIKFSETGNHDSYNISGKKLDLISKIRALQKTNPESKGISVLDFDDTLAYSNSQVIVITKEIQDQLEMNNEIGNRILKERNRKEIMKSAPKITPAEFAVKATDLEAMGAKFDFSEFNDVKEGKKGPFFKKAESLQSKFGNKDMFVLTARPQASANAIHKFLKGVGLNIPLENITGLENGSPQAKADWVLEKAANGYNDFLFADDAIKNVKAVKQVLDAVDVKSKVYQAGVKNEIGLPNLRFSTTDTNSDIFNKIIQDKKGIPAKARYSEAVARLKGSKIGNFTFYLPPSAQDFALALYNFLPKGKKGNAAWKFFNDKLIKPYNNGIAALDIARQQIHIDYQNLLKDFPTIKKSLNKTVPNSDFTYQQAIRVYLWSKAGFNIPGIAKRDLLSIGRIIKENPEIKAFADKLSSITGIKEGYTQPGDYWVTESILSDLHNITDKVGRSEYLQEFNDNVDEIFNKDNLNKIEATFGKALRDSLEDTLYRMKTGTNRSFGQNKQLNDFMMWINNSVGATMFINIRSATLQSLSTFNYINYGDNNIFKAAAAFANFPNYVKHVVQILNSAKLKQRRQGLRLNVQEAEMAEAANKGGFKGMLAYLLKIGFTPTRAIDSLAIGLGGATFLINRKKTYEKKGLSKAEAETRAFEDFSEVTERNQQSADPSKISPIQAGALGRTLFAWQNTPFQYNRVMKMAGLDLVNRRITPPYETQFQSDMSNIGKIVYYGALQNFIFNAMQTGLFALLFDEDDLDDAERQMDKEYGQKFRAVNQMVDTILRGSGLPGAIVSTMKNIIMQYHAQEKKDWGTDHTYTLIEAINLSPTLGSKARLMYSGIKSYGYEKDVIKARGLALDSPLWEIIGAEVQAFTNIPMSKAILLLRNMQGVMQERHAAWQRIATGMGWPYYQVGMELYPFHEEIKEEAKAERKAAGIEKAKETRRKNSEIKKAAEIYILENLTFDQEDEYYSLKRSDRKKWLKEKVDEYLKNAKNK